MNFTDIEIWKPVPGYKGYYEVSNHGRMKSLDRFDAQGNRLKERFLKPWTHTSGHHYVTLYKPGKRTKAQVHRLVLLTFVGPCPEGMECCHNDSNPTNNHLSNLRWDTRLGNVRDTVRNGKNTRGEQHAFLF